MVMVAEGVRAARMFRDRAIDMGIDVPFVIALNTLLDGYITSKSAVQDGSTILRAVVLICFEGVGLLCPS